MIKLLRFMKPYRGMLTLVIILAIVQSLANLFLPTLMATIVDNGVAKGNIGYIWQIGSIMLLITIVGTIAAIVGVYFSSKVAIGFGRIIRTKIFTHVTQFSLREFDSVSSSSLIIRTTNDTNQVQQVMISILNMIITAPITLVAGVVLAINQDAQLSWVLVVVIPILVIIILLLINKTIPLSRIMQVKLDKLNLILSEGLTGVRVVRAFNRQKHEEQRFNEANQDLTRVSLKVNRLIGILMPIMTLILNISSVAIIWFGSFRVNTGNLQVGALIAFVQYASQILFALLMVSMMFIMLPRAAASADRINEVLEMEPEVKDPEHPVQTKTQRGYIEFRDVSFSYPGAEVPALSHISFQVAPGEVTAIIGGTGSGKSTLISLIPRFYYIDSGQILIDNVDIRTMSQKYLRAKMGLVPQKTVLFSGSITENIRYGKRNASAEAIRHASDVAQASEFISEMSDGFESKIAQGGTNVSGGQKQRLSIARALVRKPEIYLFDDSFSALDFKTDSRLRAALKEETQKSTMLIVSQRVSTVMDANQIIVLDQGHIAGVGTHQTLMKTSEIYRDIVSSQLSAEEITEEIA